MLLVKHPALIQPKSPSFIQEKINLWTETIVCTSIPSALHWEAEREKYTQALEIPLDKVWKLPISLCENENLSFIFTHKV